MSAVTAAPRASDWQWTVVASPGGLLTPAAKSAIEGSLTGAARLRPLRPGDVTDLYVDGLNDAEVNRFLIGPRSERQTHDSVRSFVDAAWRADDAILFGLFIDSALRGTTHIHDVSFRESSCWLGLAIFDKRYWGMGWGRALIAAATEFALGELQLGTVHAGVARENLKSAQAFQRAGYRLLGASRSQREGEHGNTWVAGQ